MAQNPHALGVDAIFQAHIHGIISTPEARKLLRVDEQLAALVLGRVDAAEVIRRATGTSNDRGR